MKLNKKKLILLLALATAIICPIFYSYAQESTVAITDPDIEAYLYDTSEYNADTAVELTEEGATVSNWQYNTSKYLQVDPRVPDDNYTYQVVIELPQELYVLTDELVTPSGYDEIEFIKNESLSVNSSSTYNLEPYSGTIIYTMNSKQTSGTIQLELRYDNILWDKQSSSQLTPPDVKPINVRLEKVDTNNENTKVKEIYISEATSNEKYPIRLTTNLANSSGNIYSSTYTAKVTETLTQAFSVTSDLYPSSYFEELVITINYSSYTDSDGNLHYLKANMDSIEVPFVKSAYTIKEQEDSLIITATKPYFSTKSSSYRLVKFQYMDVSSLLEELSLDTITFSGGNVNVTVDGKNASQDISLVSGNLSTKITYDKNLVEKVTLSSNNKTVSIIGRPDSVISQMGGFYLNNSGTGDSSSKKIHLEFDTTNTNLIGVTTIALFADTVQEYMDIEYTLVDETGEKVYLDKDGNRVSSNTDGAVSSWTYSIKNSYYKSTAVSNLRNNLYRGMLPTNHQKYYFKTITYELSTIKAGTLLQKPSASSALDGTGNFYASISEDITSSTKVISKITVTSGDSNIPTLTKTVTTSFTTNSTSAYMVNNAKISKDTIEAGDSISLTGKVQEIDYPYGNSTWLSNITIGLILPVGITVNEQAITAKYYSAKEVTGITVDTPVDIGNGQQLWKIHFPSDVFVGYPDEKLGGLTSNSRGNEYLTFSIQLDTAYTMNTTTIFTDEVLFVSSQGQTNAAGGSYSWASKPDTYDLNENGETTDKIGGVNPNSTVSCQINPNSATLDVNDSISVTKNGVVFEEDSSQIISSKDDIITYNLDIGCSSGGQVSDFEYYIPIMKNSSIRDDFLIKSTLDNSYELALQNAVLLNGSEIYEVLYTFDTGLSYYTAKNHNNWYSAEEVESNNLDWKDVTMIKLLITNGVMNNGDITRFSLNLKYDGDNYPVEAGKVNAWSSGGYFYYINNGREMAGNFASTGVSAELNYELELDDITLTASKDMTPKNEGNVNTLTIPSGTIPAFNKEQTFNIKKVETYNTVLQTKDYILNNVDMPGIEANQTFGLGISLNTSEEVGIVSSSQDVLGTNSSNTSPTLTFTLYNANALSENLQSRYVIVTLESDNGVVLKQKVIINREVTRATEFQPAIVAGMNYGNLNDVSQTVTITQDASFTAQFATSYIPSLYDDQKIVFSSKVPEGTNITLVNIRESTNPTYWYYKVEEENLSEFSLNNFKKMGTTSGNNYTSLEGSDTKEEKFIVVVDFSNCSAYLNPSSYDIKLTFEGVSVDNFNSTSLNFVIKEKRTFELSYDSENVEIGDQLLLNYKLSEISAIESNYLGKKMSLVITTTDLPLDSYILVNDNDRYYLNSDNEFIIPLNDVADGSGQVSLKLLSNMLTATESNHTLNIALWVSQTANANLPKLGIKKDEVSIVFHNSGELKPALKVESLSKRLLEKEDLQGINTLKVNYIDAANCTATIELHQKVGNGYQKLTNILNQVNGSTNHDKGVFNLEIIDGTNNIDFSIASSTPIGTYRLILKVSDTEGKKLLEVPYNFLVLE